MDRQEKALDAFRGGFNCAQAVLAAFSEDLGLDESAAKRLACGFGAGMGRLQKTCGAVSGAYMAIGLKYGSFEQDDTRDPKELTYSLIREFTKEFEKRYGATNCIDLTGVDFINGDPALVSERHDNLCPKIIMDAVEIAEKIIYSTEE